MAQRSLKVGIIGGGLGGLSAAIAIARTGAQVTVLEAATELGEIGAGIHVRSPTTSPRSKVAND
jgi:salicylate hydroxylase